MGKKLVGYLSACMMFAGGIVCGTFTLPVPARAERAESETDQVGAQLEKLRQLLVNKQFVEAAANIEGIASNSPQTLNIMPTQWMYLVVRSLKDAGRSKEYGELLGVLASPDYQPIETFGSSDYFRSQYADVLFANGNVERAGKLVQSLESPDLLAKASLDPRYREFFASDPDVRAVGEERLAFHRRRIEQMPQMLGPVVSAARDLTLLGRPQEAVNLLRSVEPRLKQKDAFFDRDRMLNWWWNELGRAYDQLGNYDAMVASFRAGANVRESGGQNVSQLLNLADAQIHFGQGEAALATLASFGDRNASAYGNTVLRFTHGCASALAGHMDDAVRDLAYMREHEKDSPGNLRVLLLCMADLDATAAVFIRHLDDLELRADVLMDLSDFDDPPFVHQKNPLVFRLPALKARPDIQAAIARAGGIRRFHIQG